MFFHIVENFFLRFLFSLVVIAVNGGWGKRKKNFTTFNLKAYNTKSESVFKKILPITSQSFFKEIFPLLFIDSNSILRYTEPASHSH